MPFDKHSSVIENKNTMNKIIAIIALTICFFCQAKAQDTCVVAVRIDNKTIPFEIKTDPDGHPSGFITKGVNGDIFLYTNRPIIKFLNESSDDMRNKITGEYRVLFFDKGNATTFDYTNKTENGKWTFAESKAKNFINQIYFGNDIHENSFTFILENNQNYVRKIHTRSTFGEFDGLKNIDITISSAEGNDSIFTFKESDKVDTLLIPSSSMIKKIAATRGRNGILNAISANDAKLNTKYTYRNKEGIFDEDNYSVRSATLTTEDENIELSFPCTLSIEYSYLEGDNNVQVDHRIIYIDQYDEVESSKAWLWILLALLVIGGIGGYYYRRYQLKKAGIIPETDAEKVVRLQKEVDTHTATIKDLQKTESNLLFDKENLQKQVAGLNSDLSVSRQETKAKAVESDGFRDALAKLQEHTDDLQKKFDNALERIKVFENDEVSKENTRLHNYIEELNQQHAAALVSVKAASDAEISAIKSKFSEEIAAIQSKCTEEINAIKAETSDEIARIKDTSAKEIEAIKTQAEQEVESTKNNAAQEVESVKANADSIVKTTKANAEAEVNAANEKASREIAEAKSNADNIVKETIAKAEAEISETKANAEKVIAETKANADNVVAETKANAENEVTTAKANAESAIAEANEKAENAISEVKANAEKEIAEVKESCEKRIEEEKEKTRQANDVIVKAGDEYIQYLKSSIDKIYEQITILQSENAQSPLDNNHKNVINHLSLKFTSFRQWFEKTIVSAQEEKHLGKKEIEETMINELVPALSNNYSWITELIRFYSYSAISRQFSEEFRKSFVPVDYIASSFAESCTLFGKIGVTLHLPHLFVDDFNSELHKINNTPLINSYYPQGFIEYKTENKGLIYDLLRPGYSINGVMKQLPEVCVF